MTDKDADLTAFFEDEYAGLPKIIKVVDDHTAVINLGSNNGVKLGERFLIFQLGEELRDPESGEGLGRLEVVRGKAAIVHVQPKLSTLRSIESKRISAPRRVTRYPISAFVGREEIQEGPEEEMVALNARLGDLAKPI